MTSLFSSFDPKVYFISINWVSSILVAFLICPSFFLKSNQWKKISNLFFFYVYNEFFVALGKLSSPSNSGFFLGLFIFIFLNNSLGLLPFIFTSTSHLVFTLSFGLPLWLGHNVFSFMKQHEACLAHFIPLGTPAVLIMFMCLIELLSTVIRPFTLSIRLMANMTAGHLLFSLLSVGLSFSLISVKMYLILLIFLMLMFLEMAVSVIQGYVFALLSCLYVKEHISKTLEL